MSQIMTDEITFTNAYLGSQRRSNRYMRIKNLCVPFTAEVDSGLCLFAGCAGWKPEPALGAEAGTNRGALTRSTALPSDDLDGG